MGDCSQIRTAVCSEVITTTCNFHKQSYMSGFVIDGQIYREEVSITKKIIWTARAKRAAKRNQDAGTRELALKTKRHLCYGTNINN